MLLGKADKLYVLGVEDDMEVMFVHLLNDEQGGGLYSWVLALQPDGMTVTGGEDVVEYLVQS